MITPKFGFGQGMRCLKAAVGWALVGGGVAFAQPHTPDPYKPLNGQYDSFVFPIAPDNPALPGQARLQRESGYTGASRSNRFDQFLDEPIEDEGDFSANSRARSGGIGQPYYRAGRRPNTGEQAYIPNRKSDEKFYRSQDQRDDLFFKAIRERDPKKRAELMQQVDRMSSRTSRSAGASTARATAASTPARAATTTRSATPPRNAAPARRSPAPAAATRADTPPAPSSESPGATRPNASGSTIPPAPSLFPDEDRPAARRRSIPPAPSVTNPRAATAPRSAPTPSEILERSRRQGSSTSTPAAPR